MFQHILVPVDGSHSSQAALDKAIGLAQAFGSSLTAVYVMDPIPFVGVGVGLAYSGANIIEPLRAEAEQTLAHTRQRLQAAGLPKAEAKLVNAHDIWRGILEAAQEAGADLIVMGSHGRRGLEKLVLGSVAQSVLAHTTVHTLVVRLPRED